MDRRMLVRNFRSRPVFDVIGLVIGIFLLSIPGQSYAFQFEHGEIQGSLDTTLSFGASWRVQDQDSDIIGIANDGTAYSVNADDGNLNYDKGLVSSVAKITSELDLIYQNRFGTFIRGTAFYDFENEDGSRDKDDLTSDALDLVGSDIELLDAYIWASFDIGTMPAQVRVGEQVVSWGESTFIQNSINAVNPINVNALRLPGSELKEALLPEGMVWASIGIFENLTLEGFYLYDWDETEIDPPGSFWSTNDFAGEGGDTVMLGWGDVPEGDFMGVPRGGTNWADDSGQFGLAARAYVPKLNDTEFGFYFMKYHSRLPVISATCGTIPGLINAGNIPANVSPAIIGAYNPADFAGMVAAGVGAGATFTQAAVISQTLIAVGGNPLNPAYASSVRAASTDAYARTASYHTEYPEDIKLFGVSFNTELKGSGIALQGEISHRLDAPLQVDDIELLYGALSPFFLAAGNPYSGQLGAYLPGASVEGYIEKDVTQVQFTATKVFGPTFGADQLLILGEAALTHVHNMPSKDSLRLNGPATYVGGNSGMAYAHFPKPIEGSSHFADADSWGYRLVTRMDFNNAIGAINLKPRISWRHDVSGISPGPGGNFLEDRMAISFGVAADYQNRWSYDISYTNYFGAGRYNLINDRDIISANIKYSF